MKNAAKKQAVYTVVRKYNQSQSVEETVRKIVKAHI